MQIIQPKYEILNQLYSSELLVDMYKHIEKCGRTCYKSEDKITDTSYEKFIKMLTDSEHGAMLEHGTIYLKISLPKKSWNKTIVDKYYNNPYSKVNNTFDDYDYHYFITTNYRVMVENGWLDDLKYMCKPTEHHEKRYTVLFTCDIGVSREFNRHRKDSPAEESTRYCNYSKDKFGNELNIAKPVWISEGQYAGIGYDIFKYCYAIYQQKDKDEFTDIDYWLFANLADEYSYMNLLRLGWKPQQARIVLPLDTKTELIHTAFASDWVHFFNLRALGTTGAPHPCAKELAWPLMEEFIAKRYITINEIDQNKYVQINNKYPNIEDYIKL